MPDVGDELVGDLRQGDLGDIQLVLGDQPEQQVERPLEHVEVYLEGARAARRVTRLACGEVAFHRAARGCAHANDGTVLSEKPLSSSLSWLPFWTATGLSALPASWLDPMRRATRLSLPRASRSASRMAIASRTSRPRSRTNPKRRSRRRACSSSSSSVADR